VDEAKQKLFCGRKRILLCLGSFLGRGFRRHRRVREECAADSFLDFLAAAIFVACPTAPVRATLLRFKISEKIKTINRPLMTTKPKQLKNLPLQSRVLNANASANQKVQDYQKQAIEKAKKDIVKIEDEIKQLEEAQ